MAMTQMLVLHNPLGEVLRVFPWEAAKDVWAVFRKDTKRIEIMSSVATLEATKVPFEILQKVEAKALEGRKVDIQGRGYLELVTQGDVAPTLMPALPEEKSWYGKSLGAALILYFLLAAFMTTMGPLAPEEVAEVEKEKKREIVKIVKKKIVIPKTKRRAVPVSPTVSRTKVKAKAKKTGWKKRGVLAALGSLNNSKQKGGLDLGAVKTSAGPGLGGSQGSGGVQTNIYGKGLVAAPLGAGHNIKGGGGYGTKGKGGGKAGYGSVSMIGATGASLIPLPSQASVDGGLSSETIADVVRRNLGQVRFCYEKGLQLQPGLVGRVNVAWTIDAGGSVKIANVKNTSLKNRTVENCIVQRLKTWKFPIPQNKAEVKVSYPFLLKRVGAS